MNTFRRTITNTILSTIVLLGVQAAPVFAAAPNAAVSQACQGLSQLSSTGCATGGTHSVNQIVGQVVNVLSIIVGIAAVFVLIFAGFRFITGGSDPNTVKSAREMIIYAIVGIFIAAIAQLIVHFVLNTAANTVTNG